MQIWDSAKVKILVVVYTLFWPWQRAAIDLSYDLFSQTDEYRRKKKFKDSNFAIEYFFNNRVDEFVLVATKYHWAKIFFGFWTIKPHEEIINYGHHLNRQATN